MSPCPPGNNLSDIQRAVIDAKWNQGSLFPGSGLLFCVNVLSQPGGDSIRQETRPLKGKEQLVIVSQICDIVAHEDSEPHVEALICRRLKLPKETEYLRSIDRNSARFFVVDLENGLIAQAKYRIQIHKEVLARQSPEDWPSEPKRYERFVRWLGRRYDRPGLPDELVEHFQAPLTKLVESGASVSSERFGDFNRPVYEIRVCVQSTAPPWSIDVYFLMAAGTESLTRSESDAIDGMRDSILGSLQSDHVSVNNVIPITEDQMSVSLYNQSFPVYLDYLSIAGEDDIGAKPPPRR